MRLSWIGVAAAVVILTCDAALAADPAVRGEGTGKGRVVPARATVPGTEVRKFHITAFEGRIAPNTLRVKRGDTVRITFVSRDGTYGIRFKDFEVKDKVSPEKPAVVEFTVKDEGTFLFRCTKTWGTKHWSENGTLLVE